MSRVRVAARAQSHHRYVAAGQLLLAVDEGIAVQNTRVRRDPVLALQVVRLRAVRSCPICTCKQLPLRMLWYQPGRWRKPLLPAATSSAPPLPSV